MTISTPRRLWLTRNLSLLMHCQSWLFIRAPFFSSFQNGTGFLPGNPILPELFSWIQAEAVCGCWYDCVHRDWISSSLKRRKNLEHQCSWAQAQIAQNINRNIDALLVFHHWFLARPLLHFFCNYRNNFIIVKTLMKQSQYNGGFKIYP